MNIERTMSKLYIFTAIHKSLIVNIKLRLFKKKKQQQQHRLIM